MLCWRLYILLGCSWQLKRGGLVHAGGWASYQPTMMSNHDFQGCETAHTSCTHTQPSSIVFLILIHSATPGTAHQARSPPDGGPVGSLFSLSWSEDFSQRPPACLAAPASSDSASVGLRAAMRGRSVTASSQLTPSSPPSRPSSSSHHQGSTGGCLSTDSYPPAAVLSLGSAVPWNRSHQPGLQHQRHRAQPRDPLLPSAQTDWDGRHKGPLKKVVDLLEDLTMTIHCQDFGISLCLEGHTYKCQLKNGQEINLSTHSGMGCMRIKDSLAGHTLALVWISTTRSLSNTFQLPTLVTSSVPCSVKMNCNMVLLLLGDLENVQQHTDHIWGTSWHHWSPQGDKGHALCCGCSWGAGQPGHKQGRWSLP